MSKTIDQRVVEMQFDNSHFEKNVSTTMSTLSKLKQSLNLPGATKGLDSINTAAKNVNMSGLSSAVETVTARFSALQVMGVTALANITNSAVNAGKNIVSALTIQPITTGFSEYELKMGSIQTIMASTGESLDTVNSYLEELNKYSDQTIYSFSDMTSNIGKFTNAGVKLEDAVMAIKGISNEAAVSGANANEASRAMYNFSQALSAGYVKLIDWKSIENANMATVEFKNQLIETALALGTVTDAGNGMYKTLEGNTFNATKDFNEVFQDQWMTSEVLIETLKKYADETTDIGKKAKAAATDVKTFSQMMDTLKESAQSGWAQTWEIVFGDFNEGKSLWTTINNAVGGVIEGMSESRNKYLNRTLNSGDVAWDDFIGKVNDAGIETKDFEDILKTTMKNSGLNVEELVEKYGSLSKVFQSSEDYCYYLKKALEGVNKPMTDLLNITDKLKEGNKGNDVKRMQQALDTLGYSLGSPGVDGIFGPITESALKKFQGKVGLEPTGILDPKTLSAINKELEATSKKVDGLDSECDDLIKDLTKTSGKQLIFDAIKHAVQELKKPLQIIKDVWNSDMFSGLRLSSDELYNIIEAVADFINKLEFGEKAAENFEKICTGVFSALDISAWFIKGSLSTGIKLLSTILSAFDTDLLTIAGHIADYITKFRDWIKENTIFIGMSSKVADALTAIIDGVFRVAEAFWKLEPVQRLVTFVADAIKKFFGIVGENVDMSAIDVLVKGINAAFDKIVSWVEGLSEVLDPAVDAIIAFLSDWEDKFRQMGDVLYQAGVDIMTGLRDGIWDGAGEVFSGIIEIAKSIIEKFCAILGIASPSKVFFALGAFIIVGLIKGLLDGWGSLWETIKATAQGLIDVFTEVFQNGFPVVFEFIKTIGSKLLDAFKSWDIDIGSLAVLGVIVGLMVMMNKLVDILDKAVNPFKKLGGLFDTINDSIKDLVKAKKMKLWADAVRNIAVSIAILAAAFIALSFLDWSAIGKGAVAILAISAALAGLAFAASKMGDVEFAKLSGFMFSFAASVLILAKAMDMLSSIYWKDALVGVGSLAVIVAGMAAVLAIFGKFVTNPAAAAEMGKAGNLFMKMAVAVGIMALAIKLMASIPASDITKSIGIIAGLMLVFSAFTKLGSTAEYASGTGSMLLKMAIAIAIIPIVIRMIAGIPNGDIVKGLLVIAGIEVLFYAIIKVSQVAGEHASKAGSMLLKMAGAIIILAVAMKLIATLSYDDVIKGLICIAGIEALFYAFIQVSKLAKDDGNKAGSMIFKMAAGMAMVAIAIKIIAGISAGDIAKGLLAVAAMEALFAAIIGVSSMAGEHADKAGTMLLKMSGAILILAAAIAILSLLDPKDVAVGTAAISALLVCFALITAASGMVKDCTKTLVVIAVAIALLVGAIVGLTFIDKSKVIAASAALSAVMGMLAILIATTKFAGKVNASLFILVGVVALLGGLLYLLSGLPVESTLSTAKSLSILLLSLAATTAILSVIGGISAGAIAGAIALVSVIGIIGAAMIAIGALVKYVPSLEDFLDRGIGVLEKIGYGIGSFVGNIVSGLAEGALSGLPEIGKHLSDFMTNAKPFIEGANTVNENTLKGVGILAAAIAALSVANVIDSMASIFSFGSSFSELGTELSNFATNVKPFMTTMQSFTPETLEGVSALADALIALTGASLIEGISRFLPFSSSIAQFGDGLPELGSGLRSFIDNIGTFTETEVTTIKCAVNAIKELTKASEGIDGQSSLGRALFGDNSLATFSTQFGDTATALKTFVTNLGTFTEEQVSTVKCAGDAIIALAKAGSNINGQSEWAKVLFGDNSLATFASQFGSTGTALKTFVSNLGTFTEDQVATVKCAGDAIKALAAAGSNIDGQADWAKKLFGDNGLGAFSSELPATAENLKLFVDNLGTFGEEQIATVNSAVGVVKAMAKLGAVDLADMATNLGPLGSNIVIFADDLVSFCDKMSGIDGAGVESITSSIISAITNLASELKSTSSSLETAGTDLAQSLANGISEGASKVETAGTDLVSSAADAIEGKKGDFEDAGDNLGSALVDGIEARDGDVESAVETICDSGLSAAESFTADFVSAGNDFGSGLVRGINAKKQDAWNAGYALGQAAVAGEKAGQKSNSPSKLTTQAGVWFGEGLVIGIDSMGKAVYKSGHNMGETAVNSMSDAIRNITDIINTDIDTQPTIRPILDLSEVESGANSIGGLLNMNPSVGVMSNIRSINSMMNANRQNGTNADVVSAINKLRKDLGNVGGTTNNIINGVTYDDGSNVRNAVEEIVRYAKIGGRV